MVRAAIEASAPNPNAAASTNATPLLSGSLRKVAVAVDTPNRTVYSCWLYLSIYHCSGSVFSLISCTRVMVVVMKRVPAAR